MTTPLPPWPIKSHYTHMSPLPSEERRAAYYYAMSEAALARLRVAVEALEQIKYAEVAPSEARGLAVKTLVAIGELPD